MTTTAFKKRIRLKGFDYKGCFRYSLTFCTRDKRPYFADSTTVRNTASFLRDAANKYQFKIWSLCFMPDHVHVLAEGETPQSDMKKFAAAFKQKSGFWFRQMQQKQATLKGCPTDFSPTKGEQPKDLWQINYYEHVLRSDEATEKVARYILDNPIRKGLAEDCRDYPFSMCDLYGFVGQGFSLAKDVDSCRARPQPCESATLKGCPTNTDTERKFRTPQSNGFTLIEIVITVVLVGILSGVAALIIMQGVQTYSDEDSRSNAHYQTRLAVERMAREVRMIRSTGDMTTYTAIDLRFVEVDGTTSGFNWANPTLNRWNGAGNDVLASGVTAFSFSYFRSDGVTPADLPAELGLLWFIDISLTDTQGSETLQMRTRVHPRNF